MEIMELPKVLIWKPVKEEEYGHVALKTDKYYVSIWPARYFKENINFSRLRDGSFMSDVKDFMCGVEGSLVLNINVDRENEGGCDPDEYEIEVAVSAVTNEDLNPIIEEFLLYNEINPEDVTLKRGEELFRNRQEYDKLRKLSPEEAEMVIEPQQPETSLLKTRYSFSTELLRGNEVAEPFYHKQQSCVSLVFNLFQVAWLKHHPDRPIPIVVHEDFDDILSHNENKKRLYRVTWFESVVRKNFISMSNSNHPSFIKPLSMFRRNVNANVVFFECILDFFLFLLLGFASFFYPFWRNTVIFGICLNGNYHRLSMIHFHIVLFLMILSYIDPVIPFISIMVVYHLYRYCKILVEMKRLGEFKESLDFGLTVMIQSFQHLVENLPESSGFFVVVREMVLTVMRQLKQN